jgi:hypothetical protein
MEGFPSYQPLTHTRAARGVYHPDGKWYYNGGGGALVQVKSSVGKSITLHLPDVIRHLEAAKREGLDAVWAIVWKTRPGAEPILIAFLGGRLA